MHTWDTCYDLYLMIECLGNLDNAALLGELRNRFDYLCFDICNSLNTEQIYLENCRLMLMTLLRLIFNAMF